MDRELVEECDKKYEMSGHNGHAIQTLEDMASDSQKLLPPDGGEGMGGDEQASPSAPSSMDETSLNKIEIEIPRETQYIW